MEFALLVWFIEVFTETSYIMSTFSYLLVSITIFVVTFIMAGIVSDSTNKSPNPLDYWWAFMKTKAFKPWAYLLVFIIFANMFGNLLPNKDAAYKIAAAYGVQQAYEAASESEDVKRMAGKSLSVLETSMDRYLTEGLDTASEDVKEVTKETQEVTENSPVSDTDAVEQPISNELKEKASTATKEVGSLLIDKLSEAAKEELQK